MEKGAEYRLGSGSESPDNMALDVNKMEVSRSALDLLSWMLTPYP
jgi:hypothetical protein